MRPVAVSELHGNTTAVLNRAQRERVVITRSGKPCAIVIGVENYDAEDFDLARSADFWRLIEARRQGPMMLGRRIQSGTSPRRSATRPR